MGSRWVRTVYGAPPVGAAPTRGRMREGARADAMVSRTTTAARERNLRVGRTRRTGKRDMRPKPLSQRRSDPTDLIERIHGTERAKSRALLHDPRRQRRSDPGQAIQFVDRGQVHVDGFHRRFGARRARRPRPGRWTSARQRRGRRRRTGGRVALPRSAPPGPSGPRPTMPPAGDDRVDAGELVRERGSRRRGGRGVVDRAPPADAGAERGDRGDEDQGLAFGRRRHQETLRLAFNYSRTESLRA